MFKAELEFLSITFSYAFLKKNIISFWNKIIRG